MALSTHLTRRQLRALKCCSICLIAAVTLPGVSVWWWNAPPGDSDSLQYHCPVAMATIAQAASRIRDRSEITAAVMGGHDPSGVPADPLKPLEENRDAIELVRTGLRQDHPATSEDMAVRESALVGCRALANLLMLDARVKRSEGDSNGALNADLDCIQLGLRVMRIGAVMPLYTGAWIEEEGQKEFWSDYWSLNAAQSQAAAQTSLLIAVLALHSYSLDHDRYPETLQDLTPRYLSRIPTDPFNDDRPLRYRREREGYVLYSVGPDARDDGGQPCHAPESNQSAITSNCNGDILAGVNG